MPQHTFDEGVTKFTAHHTPNPLPTTDFIQETLKTLNAWRRILQKLDTLGQHPHRYGGVGFGNVSARIPPWTAPQTRRPFLVSGTQTGALPWLNPQHASIVTHWHTPSNQVWSTGPIPPSSESMTHGTLYDLGPHIRCVLHIHCPTLWAARTPLNIPTTHPKAAYGTPEMTSEVRRLWSDTGLSERGLFAMAGHLDGVVAFAPSIPLAGARITQAIADAYALEGCS